MLVHRHRYRMSKVTEMVLNLSKGVYQLAFKCFEFVTGITDISVNKVDDSSVKLPNLLVLLETIQSLEGLPLHNKSLKYSGLRSGSHLLFVYLHKYLVNFVSKQMVTVNADLYVAVECKYLLIKLHRLLYHRLL